MEKPNEIDRIAAVVLVSREKDGVLLAIASDGPDDIANIETLCRDDGETEAIICEIPCETLEAAETLAASMNAMGRAYENAL